MRQPIVLGYSMPSAEEAELNDQLMGYCWDGYKNEFNSWVKRKGEELFSSLGESKPVTGSYESVAGDVYQVCNGKLFTIDYLGVKTEITPADGAKLLAVDTPVNWAEDGHHILLADETHVFYIASGQYYRVDTIVSGATHVCYVKGYLVTNGLITGGKLGDITYCIKEDDGTYTASKFGVLNSESLPDGIAALFWVAPHLICIGYKSTETYWATGDANGPFAPVDASFINKGTVNGRTCAVVGQAVIFASSAEGSIKIFSHTPSQGLTEIQQPIQKMCNSIVELNTLQGWAFGIAGKAAYILKCTILETNGTTSDHTVIWHSLNNQWYEWTDEAEYPWRIASAVYVSNWACWLVGDSLNTGKVFKHIGLTDDGTAIIFEVHSGNVNRDVDLRKFCKMLSIHCSRGQTDSTTVAATLKMYWRNELGAWHGPRTISLGVHDDLNRRAQREVGLGSYTDRMWSLVADGIDSGCLISGLEETFTFEK